MCTIKWRNHDVVLKRKKLSNYETKLCLKAQLWFGPIKYFPCSAALYVSHLKPPPKNCFIAFVMTAYIARVHHKHIYIVLLHHMHTWIALRHHRYSRERFAKVHKLILSCCKTYSIPNDTTSSYCFDRKARPPSAQSFTLRQQAKTIEFTQRDQSTYASYYVQSFTCYYQQWLHAAITRYCLFVPHICGLVLRAHPVRGESHIQRNASGEVATVHTIVSWTSHELSTRWPSGNTPVFALPQV